MSPFDGNGQTEQDETTALIDAVEHWLEQQPITRKQMMDKIWKLNYRKVPLAQYSVSELEAILEDLNKPN